MKNTTIITLGLLMGISFVVLLFMQVHYVEEVLELRSAHLEESISRSMAETAHQLEIEEATSYLMQGRGGGRDAVAGDSAEEESENGSEAHVHMSDKLFTKHSSPNMRKRNQSLNDLLRERYAYQKNLVDEVIYNILYVASDKPLNERIDFHMLDQTLRTELMNNGIDLPYHFAVYSSNGTLVYQCPDYDTAGESLAFTETIFKGGPVQKMATLKVHFPILEAYHNHSYYFLMPSLFFMLILLVAFIIFLTLTLRQKKLTEVKNDFINNMTHEFKTPISSIYLAAQMLCDESVTKTPKLVKRLSDTIHDETKRLQFQVEKVLQLSMYEKKARLNQKEVDANELIAGVIHTFALKVEKNGGKIISDLQADNPFIYVDEMHFTNVIFNLMDNAVKYRRDDTQLELKLSTWNDSQRLYISIQDNGIGIKREDLKRIFEKFYRTHTGNRHDVKGFGLGLAYVKKIITEHRGTIHAESELGIGTKFIIRMPVVE